jgi:hypothetical protein
MTNDPRYLRLLEISWRRALTESEQNELAAFLTEHSEAEAAWKEDQALTQALTRLPDAVLSSNFEARVQQAVDLERAAERRAREKRPRRLRLPWLAPVASAMVVVAAALLFQHYSRIVERRNMAEGLAVVANVSSLPSPRILEDFDAIRAMNSTPPPDEQLLRLLQ